MYRTQLRVEGSGESRGSEDLRRSRSLNFLHSSNTMWQDRDCRVTPLAHELDPCSHRWCSRWPPSPPIWHPKDHLAALSARWVRVQNRNVGMHSLFATEYTPVECS